MYSLGKPSKKKMKFMSLPPRWKNVSIFFQLPYWKSLLIRHNIDVMHTEKNVCDNILNTLLGMDGKYSKDNLSAHFDLQDMKIYLELHPRKINDSKWEIPKAIFNFNNDEKTIITGFWTFSDGQNPSLIVKIRR